MVHSAIKTTTHSAAVTVPPSTGQNAARGSGTTSTSAQIEALIHRLIG
jgi:hypothetical protein